MKNELNAFLALLEDRPETFRELLRGQKRASVPLAPIQDRIRQTAENLKCQAVKQAIREIYKRTLRLEPNQEDFDKLTDVQDAYYMGVQAVEELLAQTLETCEETEKKLGPAHKTVP